ncbi:hypothetical protein GD1_43 [Paraglaciecola Antarctic GD virus 1]|nr:hypothetical protein GD1_43 [Paraglaciecola Antarctic GD virus 1]
MNVSGFKKLVYLFLTRDHQFSTVDALFELNLIVNLGMAKLAESAKVSKLENDLYVRTSRVGASKRLSRSDKIDIAMTINNAINHSYYGTVALPY